MEVDVIPAKNVYNYFLLLYREVKGNLLYGPNLSITRKSRFLNCPKKLQQNISSFCGKNN